jgi:hypothetical protein
VFSKIKAMGDEAGDSGMLRELNFVYGSQIVLEAECDSDE